MSTGPQVQDLVIAPGVTVPHLVLHSLPRNSIVHLVMGSPVLPGCLRVPEAIGGPLVPPKTDPEITIYKGLHVYRPVPADVVARFGMVTRGSVKDEAQHITHVLKTIRRWYLYL